jgi:hypothetical protein
MASSTPASAYQRSRAARSVAGGDALIVQAFRNAANGGAVPHVARRNRVRYF